MKKVLKRASSTLQHKKCDIIYVRPVMMFDSNEARPFETYIVKPTPVPYLVD